MPPTYDQFCQNLVETGLLSAADVEAVVAALPAAHRPRDAQELVRELVRLHKLTAYQAQQIYQGKGKGLQLGNYVVLDKIGQGGMGLVLKAEHKRMRRAVALKVIRPRAVESPAALKRFHREVEAAAKLIHPNIVTAFDADEYHGLHFLVMEFVDGSDLSTLVKVEGPLSLDTATRCVLQTARGLEYAHSRGIVHRDIKPRNLLLDRGGNVKILDMGLARIETSTGEEQADLTGSGQIMGTIDYMAPEQAVNPKLADERADIYSLGITWFYLVAGRIPYPGDTVLEKLVAHREQPLPSLADVCPEASPDLDATFRRMIAKKPAQRYASMTEVIAELERCRVDPSSSSTVSLDPAEGRKLQEFLRGIREASDNSTIRKRAASAAATSAAATAPAQRPPPAVQAESATEGDSAGDTSPESVSSFPLPVAAAPPPTRRKAASPPPRPPEPVSRRNSAPVALLIAAIVFAVLAVGLALVFALRERAPSRPRSTAQRMVPPAPPAATLVELSAARGPAARINPKPS